MFVKFKFLHRDVFKKIYIYLIIFTGEPLQLVWLNRFVGYLKVLGKGRFLKVLLSSAHLRKLLLTLVNIAEFDCSKVSLLEDVTKIGKINLCMSYEIGI